MIEKNEKSDSETAVILLSKLLESKINSRSDTDKVSYTTF